MSAVGFAPQLLEQWKNPGDILSVLLIVGADVIGLALAQFSGSSFKPVAFSFGWVAYAYTFLLKTAGRLKLTPEHDFPHVLVRCGLDPMITENPSWLLGRLVSHYDMWMPAEIKGMIDARIEERWEFDKLRAYRAATVARRPTQAGLAVAVFEPSRVTSHELLQKRDIVFWLGPCIATIQAAVAAIPWGLHGDWTIMLVTCSGTALAWLFGALQEVSTNARRDGNSIYALSQGNGSQNAVVIIGNGHGVDLGDLASEKLSKDISYQKHNRMTTYASIMVLLWTALLITTSGIKSHTWYLLGIGAIGMLQNIYVAGARRRPGAYGLDLDFVDGICERKVMETLYAVEEKYPTVGSSLRPIFFPGALRDEEMRRWAELKDTQEDRLWRFKEARRQMDANMLRLDKFLP